jgi:folate-binding protein YgfZ
LHFLVAILSDRGFVVVGNDAFTGARVEAGVPLFGIDFDEQNFPQEVGRDREAISFTKGCYLGQETVARIDALGHVNQRLVGVRFSGTILPDVGTELLHSGKKVGQITSVAYSPRLNAPLALAMVRRETNSPGTRLESGLRPCEVVSLPIVS